MVEIDFNQTAGAEIQCRNDIAVEVEVQVAVPFAFAASRRYSMMQGSVKVIVNGKAISALGG